MRTLSPCLPVERTPPLSWQSTDCVCPMAWWGWIHLQCVEVGTGPLIDALLSAGLYCMRECVCTIRYIYILW